MHFIKKWEYFGWSNGLLVVVLFSFFEYVCTLYVLLFFTPFVHSSRLVTYACFHICSALCLNFSTYFSLSSLSTDLFYFSIFIGIVCHLLLLLRLCSSPFSSTPLTISAFCGLHCVRMLHTVSCLLKRKRVFGMLFGCYALLFTRNIALLFFLPKNVTLQK